MFIGPLKENKRYSAPTRRVTVLTKDYSFISLNCAFSSPEGRSNSAHRTCQLSVIMRLSSEIWRYSTKNNALLRLQKHKDSQGLATATLDWLRCKKSIKASFFSTQNLLFPDEYSHYLHTAFLPKKDYAY